ncbi:MAG: formate acetyltransferase, partial [Candidatus Lokiarchaeota archaeon]|nr:formate acetyltransferase [Candidatus Lokiarchaeota archaeon]MBD3201964.1 formate acetyltransferase [Candidatus Lokiarchaeota archaeon]
MQESEIKESLERFKNSLSLLDVVFSRKRFKKEIYNEKTGFIFNAKYLFTTRDNQFDFHLIFKDGNITTGEGKIDDPNITIIYKDTETLATTWNKSADETLEYLLDNSMSYKGNMCYLTKFSYLTDIATGAKIKGYKGPKNQLIHSLEEIERGEEKRKLKNEELNRKVDEVRFLDDPYLSKYTIQDFPRLKALKNRRRALKPAICIERAKLLTDFHIKNGFEKDKEGIPINPELRQAKAVNYIMKNRKPIIHKNHLIAGSTTSKEVGVPIYPELIGTAVWPELRGIGKRKLNPNDIDKKDADILSQEVFPYWMERNVREYCRKEFDDPFSQWLEERWVFYFMMKNNAISHTVPGFTKILKKGLERIKQDYEKKENTTNSPEEKSFFKAVQIAIEGIIEYSRNLSKEASRLANELDSNIQDNKDRITELREISRICGKVPAKPADTLHEAIQSIWTSFVCIHSENANSAMSIGRLDQMLQPYFISDIEKFQEKEKRQSYIEKAIELVGSLFLRINDHDPLVPSIGNKLFGGSSSDDTVTVGGVDKEGKNAVCDMTYLILKTNEMLCFQDPNMNARYYPSINSEEYLRRLVEVNINMISSPSIHNDKTMIEALVNEGFALEDARDWAATGCVEPTIPGKHYGHTNCMLLNMVAPLEMALHDGVHPLIGEQIGPNTGLPSKEQFQTFNSFFKAYKEHLKLLIANSIEINNYLGRSHQYIHPTPLLSAFYEGPLEKGKDLIQGGAKYNTSGVALVALSDAVDSLYTIKKLIYENGELDYTTLNYALEDNFENGSAELLDKINKIPKFGSESSGAQEIAEELIDFCYEQYKLTKNYRGGDYLVGYWSISYHVGYGILTGALPSGRKAGEALTPGLTPMPG